MLGTVGSDQIDQSQPEPVPGENKVGTVESEDGPPEKGRVPEVRYKTVLFFWLGVALRFAGRNNRTFRVFCFRKIHCRIARESHRVLRHPRTPKYK